MHDITQTKQFSHFCFKCNIRDIKNGVRYTNYEVTDEKDNFKFTEKAQ